MNAKQLPSGSWRVQVYINGERKSITRPTKKEAEYAALEYSLGKKHEAANITVGKAIDDYIAMKDGVLSPSTIQGYKKIRRVNLKNIMDMRINDVDMAKLQKAFNNEAKAGASSKTLANVRGLLSSAFKAVGLAAPEVTIPAKQKRMVELAPISAVIDAVRGSDIEIPVLLACCLSLSMSEVRGLEYGDIKDGYISVVRTVLDVDGEKLERNATKAYERRRKLKLPEYIERLIGKGEGKIVTMPMSTISKKWTRIQAQNNIPHMRFHDLRHLNASVMLALNVPDKYAMERGGWKTNSVMKNVYQHTFSCEREAIDDKINDYLGGLLAHEIAHDSDIS